MSLSPLAFSANRHGGVEVDPDAIPAQQDQFEAALQHSLESWNKDQYKAVWLLIKPEFAHYIASALRAGFSYHHTQDDNLMLTKRLAGDAALPPFATHTIGAGAVVIHEDHVLAVVERSHAITRPNYFKLPGGMLERGEHIADGAMREVLEETGVQTQFEGVVCFRHHHVGSFSTSNIYAVCKLKPLSFEIVMDEVELCQAKWMPLQAYFDSDEVGAHNKHVVKAALDPHYLKSVNICGYMASDDEYEIYSPID